MEVGNSARQSGKKPWNWREAAWSNPHPFLRKPGAGGGRWAVWSRWEKGSRKAFSSSPTQGPLQPCPSLEAQPSAQPGAPSSGAACSPASPELVPAAPSPQPCPVTGTAAMQPRFQFGFHPRLPERWVNYSLSSMEK